MKPIDQVVFERFPAVLEEHIDFVERVANRYRELKRQQNGVDFDDLLSFLLELLKSDEGIGTLYAQRFEHVLVDEFQDTNPIQFEILRALTRIHGNLTAVGDDAQSIYSWRGAALENLLEFEDRFPGARIFRVESNYRSQPAILDLANCAISMNRAQLPKVLRPVRDYAIPPVLVHTWDLKDQARFLVERAEGLLQDGVEYGRMAILFRSHFQSVDAQMALRKAGIPFAVVSGIRFFELAHVRDVLAFIRLAASRQDQSAFIHLACKLPRIGQKTALRLWAGLGVGEEPVHDGMISLLSKVPEPARAGWEAWAELMKLLSERLVSPRAMVETILASGYREHLELSYQDAASRIQDLRQLSDFASGFSSVDLMLGELALMSNVEADAESDNGLASAIWMGTVHQAKGLEWDHVFVIGLNQGVWPTGHAIVGGDLAIEEERRLFYVAMTRARDGLYLMVPGHRLSRSWEQEPLEPSQFIEELDPDLLERVRYAPEDAYPMDY
jgi:DNA helicase-2/ATP-dependent DNA helicase PcrA